MTGRRHSIEYRVPYSDTDQMKTYYNSRALEWFELVRTELLREMGTPYREWESRGVFLPIREAHVEYEGRAQYDDLLRLDATLEMVGRTQLRLDVRVTQAESGDPVCNGYTIHVIANVDGKPIRPPQWLREMLDGDDRYLNNEYPLSPSGGEG